MSKPRTVSLLESQLPKNRKPRVIDLEGEINMHSATKFCRELEELIEEDRMIVEFNNQMRSIPGGEAYTVPLDMIRINISTPGGYIYWGCMILDTLDECIADTHMHVRGLCASMGIPIFCKGNMRTAGRHATFMIHGSSTGLWGYTEDLKGQLQYQEEQDALLDKIVLESTKVTEEQMEYAKVRSWFFGYEQALDLGLLTQDVYAEFKKEKDCNKEQEGPTLEEISDKVANLVDQVEETINKERLNTTDIIEIEGWMQEVFEFLNEQQIEGQEELLADTAIDCVYIIDMTNAYADEYDMYRISNLFKSKFEEIIDLFLAEDEEIEAEEVDIDDMEF